MRKIRDCSEDEMIAVYVQTEVNSSRFRADIEAHAQQERIDPRILHMPDWHNAQENASRRAILGVHRGYGRNEGYFQGFPADVQSLLQLPASIKTPTAMRPKSYRDRSNGGYPQPS